MISLILFAVGVEFYALSQAAAHGKLKDNPDAKYAIPKRPGKGWYYRLSGVKYAEKFPLSATLLVSLTDRYHKFQLGFKLLVCGAVVTYVPLFGWLDVLIYFAVFGLVFSVVYRIVAR